MVPGPPSRSQTTSSSADIQLIADSDHDGSGGVWIQQTGLVNSGRDVVLEGSNLFATGGLGGPLDSVRIDSDGANFQVIAAGNISIRQSAFAPTGSDTIIEGRVQATGTGSIDVSAKNVVQLAADLSTGAGAIALHSPVVLTGNSQLASVSGAVTLDGTVNGDAANNRNLAIDTAGAVLFSGAIGNSFSLAALNVTSSGSLTALGAINSGSALFNAMNGVSLTGSLTVASPLSINADSDGNGAGTFTLGSSATVTTAGNKLSITAADVNLQGALNSGSAETELLATNGRTVGLGLATGDFTLSGAELARITAATLHLGGANAGTISVNGVTAAQNQQIGQVVLEAGRSSAELRFIGSASVFQVLSGTARGAITVDAPLQVIDGDLTLESAAAIVVNQTIQTPGAATGTLTVTGGVTINAPVTVGTGDVTLRATGLDLVIAGGVIDAAVINFTAPRDIIIGGTLQTTVPGGSISLKADGDRDASGGVWIQGPGALKAAGIVTLEGSDLFATPGALDSILIDSDGANPQIVAGGGITLRGGAAAPSGADVVVGGQIQATGSGAVDIFSRDQIRFSSTILSDVGDVTLHAPLVLTGDASIETSGGDILFTSAATIDSVPGQPRSLQLNSAAGDVVFGAAVGGSQPPGSLIVVDSNSVTAVDLASGTVSFKARNSINLNGNVSTTGTTVFVADADSNGTGDFALASGKSVLTHGNLLSITAADVDLLGTLSSGAGEMQFHASTKQARIGAGDASTSFSISNAEIGRVINTTGRYR